MTLLGYLLQLGIAGFLVYLGNTEQLNYIYLLVAPVGFMIGRWMTKLSSRSTKPHRSFFQFIGDLISAYVIGLVATALLFGLGFALLHILNLRPPPGIGRY